jgi:hypothetical protein
VVPVELESFTAIAMNNSVELSWITASEINNHSFEIERNSGNGFMNVGFIQGHGTTTEKQTYSYLDENLPVGKYTYRLTQIDHDGTNNIIGIVETEISSVPLLFELSQNFPNPFNPSTVISYQIAEDGFVSLKIFDLLGNEVADLVSSEQTKGNYSVRWDADGISSGVYFYNLKTSGYNSSKKLMLLR